VTEALPQTRRPAAGAAWRVLALYVGPALLLGLSMLVRGPLPWTDAPPSLRLLVAVETLLVELPLIVAWAVVVVVRLSSRGPNRRHVWELGTPVVYGFGGIGIAVVTGDRLELLADRLGGGLGVDPPVWYAVGWAAAAVCVAAGLVLGRRAAATEAAQRTSTRAVWISSVDAGRSWWLWQAAIIVPGALLFALLPTFGGWWGERLEAALVIVSLGALVAAWGSRGSVSISPEGIRVSIGHVGLVGWSIGIEQIASVGVADVRLVRGLFWTWAKHFGMRDGPALIVTTRGHQQHVITLPDAEDAAAVLGEWLARRQAPAAPA
jgi:hypothetical protein